MRFIVNIWIFTHLIVLCYQQTSSLVVSVVNVSYVHPSQNMKGFAIEARAHSKSMQGEKKEELFLQRYLNFKKTFFKCDSCNVDDNWSRKKNVFIFHL